MTSSGNDLVRARRRFLKAGGLAATAAFGLSPLGQLLARAGGAHGAPSHPGYGRLRPVRDLTTGLPLLRLPEGFSYITFGWAGEEMQDGAPCPGAHDGMGLVCADGDLLTLVRNHEVVTGAGSFAPASATYDARCAGGTATLRFDAAAGKLVDMRPSLSGTLQNCAGGITPWGSWLSCEEFVSDPGEVRLHDGVHTLARSHGYVFEVPADGLSRAEPIVGMGRMRHEAATVYPRTGDVYLTEDQETGGASGFYRFIPKVRDDFLRGGRLQMLKAVGQPDLRAGQVVGRRLKVEWVEIEDPDRGFDADGQPIGLQAQGYAGGASKFSRLEGGIAGDDVVYFTSTNGGDAACGQVWAYYPESSELALVFEPSDPAVLDYPDNVVLSPRGGLVICQDAKGPRQHLYGLTAGGELFAFARNDVVLDGAMGFSGDYRGQEWAGSCFSPDGKWLFANVYRPGFSVAITGPWKTGLI